MDFSLSLILQYRADSHRRFLRPAVPLIGDVRAAACKLGITAKLAEEISNWLSGAGSSAALDDHARRTRPRLPP